MVVRVRLDLGSVIVFSETKEALHRLRMAWLSYRVSVTRRNYTKAYVRYMLARPTVRGDRL